MVLKKTAICIDNGYFSKLCIGLGVPKVYLNTLMDYVAERSGAKEHSIYIYDCMPYQSKVPTEKERMMYAKKNKFFDTLQRKHGFIIRLGKLQKIGKRYLQKKVDTLWTADISMLSYKGIIDKVILVSGDSDFIPGIKIAQSEGVHTVLWYGESENTGTSFDLIKTCDEIHKITSKLLKSCKMEKNK